MASIYERAVALISKPAEARRDFEVQPLLPWFQKRSPIFRSIKLDCLKDIVKNCSFVQKQKNEIVIRQGDVGNCFYIILYGDVTIYNKDDIDKDDPTYIEQLVVQRQDISFFPDRSKLGSFVTKLGTGSNFGDIALVTGDCKRTASIIANETTDFIEVAVDLYNLYVRDVITKDYEQRTSFIQNNPLFSGWAPKYRKQLAMALYKEELPYDSTLVKQGEPLTNIYFIISGQVEVKLDAAMHAVQYPKLFQLATSSDTTEKTPKSERKVSNELPHVAAKTRREGQSKSVKICYLAKNGSIGDTEVLMEMETYLQTAVCVEKTEVLVLEMKHYDRLFAKRHPKTIDAMKAILEVRLKNRLSTSPNTDLPLLKHIVLKLNESKGRLPIALNVRLNNRLSTSPNTDLPLLKHIVLKLHETLSATVNKEISKKGVTSADAEQQFLNYRGPLIDLYGPGSVFHAIRMREKSRTKLRIRDTSPKTSTVSAHAYYDHHVLTHRSQLSADPSEYYVTSPVYDVGNFGADYGLVAEAFMLRDGEGKILYTSAEDEVALTNLEERMRKWMSRNSPKTATHVRSLRRLAVQNIDDFPKQGHKVIVRRRMRRSDMTSFDKFPSHAPQAVAY